MINPIKSDPVNSSINESSVYKYGELCQLIEHSLKPKAFNSRAIQLRDGLQLQPTANYISIQEQHIVVGKSSMQAAQK